MRRLAPARLRGGWHDRNAKDDEEADDTPVIRHLTHSVVRPRVRCEPRFKGKVPTADAAQKRATKTATYERETILFSVNSTPADDPLCFFAGTSTDGGK